MRNGILSALIITTLLLGGCAGQQQQGQQQQQQQILQFPESPQPPQFPQPPISETHFLLDTICTITIYGAGDTSLLKGAFELCAEYEALLSRTLEGSDIWRINHAGGSPVTVDPRTAALIEAALEFGDFSGGAFDITIGRLSELWDFNCNPSVPSGSNLDDALKTVGYRQVIVTDDTVVQLIDPEAWLDLGGIAKGYIADQIASFLKEQGIGGAVIDLGGNIMVVGTKPDGNLWRVGVKQPFDGGSEIIGALTTGEASIVTSGIYERQFMQDGVLYHHILDPGTGMPAKSDIVSATIVTESSTVGDALSTILILAGSERAAELLPQIPGFYGAVLMLDSGERAQYGDIDFQ
jgi:thiamine biosynthesis lipoprotein